MFEEFFRPRQVAVIGASSQPGKVGHDALKNLVSYGFAGEVLPVNPKGGEILGKKAYATVADLPEGIDLAVIAIPAKLVADTVLELGAKKVKACVVLTAGFKEIGGKGVQREKDLKEAIDETGIRLIGPNCVGIMDTAVGLNATFGTAMPKKGHIGFFSQSGAMCLAILDWSLENEIGFSKFISIGNKVDLTETDILELMVEDDNTHVILGYLEAVENGKRFMEVAREVTRVKPVILVKSGVTSAGARAASSHTGALAGSDAAYSAAFRQCGVQRAGSVRELFNLALALAHQPLPQGPNVGLVTNSGGPGIIAADAAENHGLLITGLEPETVDELRSFLPAIASVYNPVDITGGAPAELYGRSLATVAEDPNVHGVVVIMTPTATLVPEDVARLIGEAKNEKPIFSVLMGHHSVEKSRTYLVERGLPAYEFPEDAVEAMRGMLDYQRWRNQKPRSPQILPGDKAKVAEVIAGLRAQSRRQMSETEARACFGAYGIRLPRSLAAATSDEAVAAAEELGYPVAMKIDSPAISHKSDVGGVKVNLADAAAVRQAFWTMTDGVKMSMPEAWIRGVLVQEMVRGGRETIVGLSKDPGFGHLLMFGLGGIYVEVLKDVSFRVAPVSQADAEEMIREIRTFHLLRGVRGEPPSDLPALAQVLLAVSSLAHDFPEVAEADINPLFVLPRGQGAVAVDARISLSQPKERV
ncbi:MAG: acetate--CoA ligase family protein [Deltaproteobacteria bacterium]|nr:acetate--CoA ligase family protein [Deltaproteobacteria bacterium]